MANTKNSTSNWTGTQAYVLAVICLLAGVAIGYLVRGSGSPDATSQAPTQAASGPAGMGGGMPQGMGSQQPSPEQMKHMADTQAAPLIAELKNHPADGDLLSKIGNMYYDAQVYPEAVKYYEDSLKVNPNSTDVRTDMATAYHYMGQSDKAIQEYDKVLRVDPKHANALFNEGMVKWQDKMDMQGAIADWKRLLETNPNYPKKDQVQELIAKAEEHLTMKPGTKTDKSAVIPR
jgi:cytochrome c-type biogenesis protein CcmH/NrfG